MPLRGYDPSRPNEWERLNTLLEIAFKAEKDHRFLRLNKQKPLEKDWSRMYEYDPDNPEDKWLNLDFKEPTIIANFGIHRQPMQFGRSTVINGGGRDVGTHPSVRGKGVGLKVAADAVRFMREHEVDFSILFTGSMHFYEKNGWVGGMREPHYVISGESLEQWRKNLLNKIISAANSDQIANDEIERYKGFYDSLEAEIFDTRQELLERVTDLYSRTLDGLYFAAYRDYEYWKIHFDLNPAWVWNFIALFKSDKLLSYIRYDIKTTNSSDIWLYINEFRIDPAIGPDDEETGLILLKLIEFIEEEALQEGEKVDELHLSLSRHHTIIKYFTGSAESVSGITLENRTNFNLGTMCRITNPYSLYRRLGDEIKERSIKGIIPKGSFWIRFDLSGEYGGGALINSDGKNTSITITTDDNTVNGWKDKGMDGVEFRNNIAHTSFFANFIPEDEYTDKENLEDYDCILYGDDDSVIKWMKGLFTVQEYALYKMDHY